MLAQSPSKMKPVHVGMGVALQENMNSLHILSRLSLVFCLLAGCGDDTEAADTSLPDAFTSDSGMDAGERDAESDAGDLDAEVDTGVCISATEGETCTAGQTSCATPCAEVCNCQNLICQEGTWVDEPSSECFACGGRACLIDAQYCHIITSDIGGEPDESFCEETPAACLPEPDCACLAAESIGGTCEEAAPGALSTTTAGG